MRVDNEIAVRIFQDAGFKVCEGEGIELILDGETIRKHKMELKKAEWAGPRKIEK